MPYPSDLHLTRAIASGDPAAWNAFVQRYGDLVMSAVISWLEAGYHMPRSQYTSILRFVKGNLPEPAEEADIDREGLALYRYVLEQLKPRLAHFEGKSSLGAFLRLQLREIRHQYLTRELGKLVLPPAIAHLPTLAQDVYRLSTRLTSRQAIARRLGVPEEQVIEAEKMVRQHLQAAGKEWWVLEGWELTPEEADAVAAEAPCPRAEQAAAYHERRSSAEEARAFEAHLATCPQCRARLAFLEEASAMGGLAPTVTVPAWANRDVTIPDPGGAPDPTAAKSSVSQKILSQPQWLAGVTLGLVASAVIMIFIIPRLEYGKLVREPGEQVMAQAERPLTPELADRLAEARAMLARGKVEAAIRNLQAVLLARPENQEARWLLASTYDRLGDTSQAARHYQIYVEVADRERAIVEKRLQTARTRLETAREMP